VHRQGRSLSHRYFLQGGTPLASRQTQVHSQRTTSLQQLCRASVERQVSLTAEWFITKLQFKPFEAIEFPMREIGPAPRVEMPQTGQDFIED
jgi:hypothetical protein